jgi:hypothetical protein
MTRTSTEEATGSVTTGPVDIDPVALCPCPAEGAGTEEHPAIRIVTRTRIPMNTNLFIKLDSARYYFILLKLSRGDFFVNKFSGIPVYCC